MAIVLCFAALPDLRGGTPPSCHLQEVHDRAADNAASEEAGNYRPDFC
jgi:hypothetical protein